MTAGADPGTPAPAPGAAPASATASATAAGRRSRRRGLADTGPRFALLMAVVTASSVSMLNTVLAPRPNDTPGDALGCLLAGGLDPDGRNLDNLLMTVRSSAALVRCMSGVPRVEYAKGLVATLVLLAVTACVYWWQPRLRDRWHRTVPAEDMDPDGTLAAELAALRARAGITHGVRFRVDPTRTTAGAVVYGRSGQYVVCLHAGLLVRRATDPEGFRAVVLHELAHLHNRDVDFASASTALWRVFVLLALLPYLFHECRLLVEGLFGLTDSPFWPGAASPLVYSVLSGLLLVALVHLARADLLRRRELHADARAVDCGALPAAWGHRDPRGAVAARVRRVTALLRTHPTWAERRRALADRTRLSRVGALSMFLVGVGGSLLVNKLVVVPGLSTDRGGAWGTAVLIAPWLSLSLARSVAASPSPRPAESGARAGGWLGGGLVVGELTRGMHGNEWFGPHPEFLLSLLLFAVLAAVWSAHCAHSALALRRRGLRLAVGALNLLVTTVVLWAGLHWWYSTGQFYAAGVYSQAETFRDLVVRSAPGPWRDYSWQLSAISVLLPLLTALKAGLLLDCAALALWLVPVALWAWTGAPGLRLRRSLPAGVAGGVVCWAGLATVGHLLHGRRPASFEERAGAYGTVQIWLTTYVLIASCLLTAAAVAALSRRFWLPRALLAAAVTQLLGHAGVFVMFAANGCLGPVNTMATQCHWLPSVGWISVGLTTGDALTPATLLSGCAAAVGAMVGWGVRQLVRQWKARRLLTHEPAESHHPAPTPPASSEAGATPPRPTADDGSPTPRTRRRLLPSLPSFPLLPIGTVAMLTASAVLLTVAAHDTQGRSASSRSSTAPAPGSAGTPADSVGDLVWAPPPARRAKIRAWQALAWLAHGGMEHYKNIGDALTDLGDALTAAGRQKPRANGKIRIDSEKIGRLCVALARHAEDALDYFPVPDKALQKDWSRSLTALSRQGRTCRTALTDDDKGPYKTHADRERAFFRSLDEINKAASKLASLLDKIVKVAEKADKNKTDDARTNRGKN